MVCPNDAHPHVLVGPLLNDDRIDHGPDQLLLIGHRGGGGVPQRPDIIPISSQRLNNSAQASGANFTA